ncbi:MAG: ABC transporter permease [Candidatus Marinimicrobia bacterium]|nr:ABC transporter permease [Candidatus Neomarinimicrobiota bacterium]
MIWSIFKKSIQEQLRNYWVLLLTVSLAPFFVFVYYLINESSQPSYDILILNQDTGITNDNQVVNYGEVFDDFIQSYISETAEIPLSVKAVVDRDQALDKLEQKRGDILLIIPLDFSRSFRDSSGRTPEFEIVGDLGSVSYMVSAVWLGEILYEFISLTSGRERPYTVQETPLGFSGQLSEFDLWMPGILILSTIMLMLSATIAIIAEVDQKTILRLKMSKMKARHFLVGVGGSQVLVGIISILLTLAAASVLGFEMRGSFLLFLLITILSSISMIAFSLILAAFTRSVTEVLVVGNFPLFLFMFFTGAAFPMQGKALFHLAGYGISWQGLMSPTHAISALDKISIMGAGFSDIKGELIALLLVTMLYFIIGIMTFQKRHLATK